MTWRRRRATNVIRLIQHQLNSDDGKNMKKEATEDIEAGKPESMETAQGCCEARSCKYERGRMLGCEIDLGDAGNSWSASNSREIPICSFAVWTGNSRSPLSMSYPLHLRHVTDVAFFRNRGYDPLSIRTKFTKIYRIVSSPGNSLLSDFCCDMLEER